MPSRYASSSATAKQSVSKVVPLEHDEQVTFFEYLELQYRNIVAFAIPNAGKRSRKTGHRMKKEGLRKGVPDIMVAEKCGIYGGLFIEMKRQKGSVTSDEQLEMIAKLRAKGYFCVLARGFDEAVKHLKYYLSLGEPVL